MNPYKRAIPARIDTCSADHTSVGVSVFSANQNFTSNNVGVITCTYIMNR